MKASLARSHALPDHREYGAIKEGNGSMERNRIVIIGSGAAGWTSAIYAARAGLAPLVLTGIQHGGQMVIAGEVENFPGFEAGVEGPQLMDRMASQAMRFGAKVESDTVVAVDFSARPFILKGEAAEYAADSVIIATGATARWLGVPGESQFMGRGVSACATCDGYFFRGKDVAVVGGGNTAAEEAIHLAGICRTVHLIHRRNSLKAERILQQRLKKLGNVVYHWDSVLGSIHGKQGIMDPVTHVVVNSKLDGKSSKIEVDGVFVAIGHDPATSPFVGKIALDSNGYIKVKPGTVETDMPGVFSAGDVADPVYRQAVTAAGMGCMAALDAERWLSQNS